MLSTLAIAAGTYDGVVAGWEFKIPTKAPDKRRTKGSRGRKALQLEFATSVHSGSVRSLSLTTSPTSTAAGSLLSSGYDESLRTHEWHKRMTSSGEVRTPSDFGTPICSSYAPPRRKSTHCIIGFSEGKLAIYKKRDWSVQHVLAGHDGGVGALAVHPTGKLALTGGMADGKLKLWDLTKGRLAFVAKLNPVSTRGGRTKYSPVSSMVWSEDGNFYAVAYGAHITVREVASGKDLLDVDLPSRINQICLMAGPDGLFVVAACNDGSLPVLAVEDSNDENRRAIMAIEPVDNVVAGEERFKCVAYASGYHVVTANSAGVVSLMDLSGAVRMMMGDDADDVDAEAADGRQRGGTGDGNEGDDEDESDEDEDAEEELAVDIIDSVRLGTGARITALAVWYDDSIMAEEASDIGADEENIDVVPGDLDSNDENDSDAENDDDDENGKNKSNKREISGDDKRSSKKRRETPKEMMDPNEVEKARQLVSQAKKLKKKKDKKKQKQKKT